MFEVLKPHLKKHLAGLCFSYLLLIAETILLLYLPLKLSDILNLGKTAAQSELLRYGLLALTLIGVSFARENINVYVPNRISAEMLEDVLMQATHVNLKQLYQTKRVSSFYAMNNMTYFIPFYYLQEVPELCISVIKGVAILIILWSRHWVVALLCAGFVGVQYVLNDKLLNKMYEAEKTMQKEQNQFQQNTLEALKEYRHILANSMQDKISSKINRETGHLLRTMRKNVFWKNTVSAETYLFQNMIYFASILVVYLLVHSGKLWLGDYELILSYVLMLLNCVEQFFEVLMIRSMAKAQYSVYESSSHEVEKNGTYYKDKINEISLQDVSFGYDESMVISHMTQNFKAGKLYVLRGRNGSGKSTLINLVTGLFLPQEGTVQVNGKNLNEWNRYQYLKEQVAVSDQQTVLFFDSLQENITGKSREERRGDTDFEKTVELAGIRELYEQKKHEFYSGGEMQKIGFARMLYKLMDCKSSVLILDEPTNHLDGESKEMLYHFLEEQKEQERIVIVVSHDEHLIHMADEIVSLA